jgi:ankyrin repeat protein
MQLTDSVVGGDLRRVRESIERGANVNGGFDQSIPVLEVAASFGRTEIVKVLIEAGADINLVRPLGQTALKKAVIKQHIDTTRLLIEKGADVCEKTESSALQYAVDDGNRELIQILEKAGAKNCS